MKESMDEFIKESVINDIEQRNWKGILIALLVIVSICSLILLSILLLSPHFGLRSKTERLKLEEIILRGYEQNDFNGSWISEKEIIYLDINGALTLYDIVNRWKTVLTQNINLRQYDTKKFSVSADRRYVLLTHDIQKAGTHSYTARYKTLDTKTRIAVPLRAPDDSERLQFAQWGPHTSQLIVIHNNNIIYYATVGDRPHLITNNGREGFIYNGIPDMMYEEHILYSNVAHWWANDGSRLCYASFDNSRVETMPYVVYSSGNFSGQSYISDLEYPKIFNYPYSKPGQNIPHVLIYITELSTSNFVRTTKQIKPSREINQRDYYITAPIVWISRSSILVIWSKRVQNFTIINICREENDWNCEKIIEEYLNSPIGWLMINDAPIFTDDKTHFFLRLPVADGLSGTFDHIAMFTTDGNKKYFLTHGQYVVTKIFAHRSDLHTLYFAATNRNDPAVRHLYSVNDMLHINPRKIHCLSCNISDTCQYYNAIFSPEAGFYILECLGPTIPKIYLLSVDDNELLEILETNTELHNWTKERSMPKIRYMSIPAINGHTIRVQLILPAVLIEDEDVKYPSVVEIDARPGSQSVNYINKLDWSRYMSSKKDYISIHIDTRGTGFQGDKFMFEVYHHLGEVETEDIITSIKYLKEKLTYIDEEKIAVWGYEFGGYMAVSLLANDRLFNCGIAVSPIASWKNYYSVFSERYMGTPWPQDNYINYEKTDLTRISKNIKGKTFLLVHGTIDKRVNIEHSMLLMKSLTEQGVQYKLQLYPDSGSMESWDLHVRLHFYRTMEDFFAKCFQSEEDEEDDDILPITKVIKGVHVKKFD